LPGDNEFTRILQWPGYRVYRHEIDEKNKTLEFWVRRKRGNRKLECSGCGRKFSEAYDCRERAVRDLPWSEFRTAVHIEVYRVKCPDCGVKVEKVPLLPGKAPFSKRFEDAVGQACESASARQVARRFSLAQSTVRAIDLRYLERWAATRREPALRQMGVDEIYRGKNDKFLTVVSNLETGEPLWFGKERKKETLDEFFRTQLRSGQRRRIEAPCVNMWEPLRRNADRAWPKRFVNARDILKRRGATRSAALERLRDRRATPPFRASQAELLTDRPVGPLGTLRSSRGSRRAA
jgi:transposase